MEDATKKSLLFVNMNVPFDFKSESILLGCPRTDKVLQLCIEDTSLKLKDLSGDTEKEHRLDELKDIFHSCHTIVIPDSMFLTESSIFKTLSFHDNGGPEHLRSFFRKGGNVVIMCMEGSFGVTRAINDVFWTDWQMRLFERSEIAPTYLGQDLLRGYLPSPILDEKGFYVQAPPEEGIYGRKMVSKKEFIKNFNAQDETLAELGIERDETMDCFNPEKSWITHLERYKNRYCIAIHQGSGPSGNVVWYGDRGQTEQMAYVFLKLLNFGGESAKLDMTPLERKGKAISLDIPMQEITICSSENDEFDDEDEEEDRATGFADTFCKLLKGW